MKTFKPMLASKITDVSKLRFPVLASKKLDGIRATVQNGILLSRSLKPIPNVNVQAMFKGLPEGIDGELIYGDPCAPDAYRQTTSIVMSDDKPADGIRYHVFDKYDNRPYQVRMESIANILRLWATSGKLVIVEQKTIFSANELEELEAAWLAEGHEGVMVRSLDGPYKCGRSSEREGYLLKLKRFEDCEAKVVAVYELMHNDNEAFKNELGRTARSSCKEGKVGMGTLGGLIVTGMGGTYGGIEFRVGTGFDAAMRSSLWAKRDKLIGRIACIKYFPSGAKDKPRHPVFKGWRDPRDVS